MVQQTKTVVMSFREMTDEELINLQGVAINEEDYELANDIEAYFNREN